MLRKFLLSLSPEQANFIPTNCSNNVIWNCAHVISVQQSLGYYLFGIPMRMDKTFVKQFTAGTKPDQEYSKDFIDFIGQQLLETSLHMAVDIGLENPTMKTPFTTAIKVELTNMDEALAFINYHEGLHLGVITGLVKWAV